MVLCINKVIINLASTGFSNIIAQILTFFVGAYYARVLEPSNFGIITLIQAIISYFTMITLFGLQTYGTREVAKNKGSIRFIAGEIISFRLLIALVCCSLIFILSVIVNKDFNFKMLLIIYSLSLIPLAFNLDWLFNGIQEMHHNAVYNILKSVVPLIVIVIFFRSYKDIAYIPVSVILGLVFAAGYHIIIYIFRFKLKLNFVISKSSLKKYIWVGLPFLVSSVLAMVNNYIDRIVIGFTRSQTETGVYSSSYYLIMFLINIIAVIFTPIFPLFIEYYNKNLKKELENLNHLIARVIAIIAMPISIGGILLSKEIILLVFKKEYIDAYKPLSILLFYIFLLFIREIYGYQLNAWNKEKLYLKVVAASALTNLVLNILLTPRFGMIAAAWITVCSELINLFFMRIFANRISKTRVYPFILKALPANLIMGAFIVYLKTLNLNVIIIILLSIIIYCFLILLFRTITIEEIKKIMAKKVS